MHKREKEKLEPVGLDPAIYANPIQSITTVLTRQLMWPWANEVNLSRVEFLKRPCHIDYLYKKALKHWQ